MSVEEIMQVLDEHRWNTMGVDTVECACGEIIQGDGSLTQFPADEAFRRHVAERIVHG